MTAISPFSGGASLSVATPPPPANLHAVLAAGTNLGGTAPATVDFAISPAAVAGTAVAGASGPAAPSPTPATTTGGGGQALQGASQVSEAQLVAALQQVISAVNQLIAVLQAQRVSGGGAPGAGAVGQCGMPGCTMDHAAPAGASGAPRAPATDAGHGAAAVHEHRGVDPATVKDKTGTDGLTAASRRGLEEAHRFGLPLVSGKRSGDSGSDHAHGNAIDVGTLPIGSPGSTKGTPQMRAFAEHMRTEGKAGRLSVKYVIADGRIASAKEDWAWRPYTYPGKSAAQLEALRSSNRGDYNRIQHYDHVHVSFS